MEKIMANFRQIKKEFQKLSEAEKEAFLKDVYNYSKGNKIFLENYFLGGDGEEFIYQMQRETFDKVFSGVFKVPNDIMIRGVISRAKKAKVDYDVIMKLEKMAYESHIAFLNKCGGWSNDFEVRGQKHLEIYLKLVQSKIKGKKKQEKLFNEVSNYLRENDEDDNFGFIDVFQKINERVNE